MKSEEQKAIFKWSKKHLPEIQHIKQQYKLYKI